MMTNTFLRIDSNTMQHTVTVHDPKTYTQDWMNVRTWRHQAGHRRHHGVLVRGE